MPNRTQENLEIINNRLNELAQETIVSGSALALALKKVQSTIAMKEALAGEVSNNAEKLQEILTAISNLTSEAGAITMEALGKKVSVTTKTLTHTETQPTEAQKKKSSGGGLLGFLRNTG